MSPLLFVNSSCRRDFQTRLRSLQAFTLIEVLVVIAIVGLLAVLLTPTVNNVFQRSKEAKSLHHLRTIGQAITSYLTENNNRYPFNAAPDAGKPRWTEVVGDYLPNSTSVLKSANGEKFTIKTVLTDPLLSPDNHHQISDFGVNNAVILRETTGNSQLAAASVKTPSLTVMAMTAEQNSSGEVRGTWYVNTSGYVSGSATTFIPSDRGTGRIFCVFVDGHTEAIAKDVFETNRRKYLLPEP
jgi:prepilin-type N-terminal cleavage/methylation domain-containing protein